MVHLAAAPEADDPQACLRALGARAHQLRAAARAADHFVARDATEDRHTGAWLVSCAETLAAEVAAELDALARSLKGRNTDLALQRRVAALRVRAHQLHAAARAADHFLELDGSEGRDTGSWLVATASDLAGKLSADIDDGSAPALDSRPEGEARTTRRIAGVAAEAWPG